MLAFLEVRNRALEVLCLTEPRDHFHVYGQFSTPKEILIALKRKNLIAKSAGGIVGGGVYELVKKCIESGRLGAVGASIEVAKICVRSLDKPRDFELMAGTVLVTDYEEILADESINCVVELMGGVTR